MKRTESAVCGVTCFPYGENCNNYCNIDKTKPMEEAPMLIEAEGTWCTYCGARFKNSFLEMLGASGCPNCRNIGIPCDAGFDIKIEINWHELRILCMWAAAQEATFTEKQHDVVPSIIGRIEQQYPKLAKWSPLSLFVELQQLRESIKNGNIKAGKVETNIEPLLMRPINGNGAVNSSNSKESVDKYIEVTQEEFKKELEDIKKL